MYVAGRNDPVSPSVYLQWACTRLASIGKIEARWLSATEGRNQKNRSPGASPIQTAGRARSTCSVACGGRGRDVLLTRPNIWKELDPPRPEAVPPVLEPKSGRLLVKQVIQASRPLGFVRQIARLKHCKASSFTLARYQSTFVSGHGGFRNLNGPFRQAPARDTREAQMTAPSFIFATGIENSNPTIKNGDCSCR